MTSGEGLPPGRRGSVSSANDITAMNRLKSDQDRIQEDITNNTFTSTNKVKVEAEFMCRS